MAEAILFPLAGKILSTLSPLLLDQISLPWYAKDELRKLEHKITTIRNVLLNAQELQKSNDAVKEWLLRLKNILCEADDLFDEVATEALQRDVVINKSTTKKVCYFFTSSNPIIFHYSLGQKIKVIRERLDEICTDMKDFGFVVGALDKTILKRNEGTTSFVDTHKIIGRDNDKKTLLQLILSPPDDENVHVIPIVGMGGLGKTTLAQMIFNDKTIKSQFVEKVCVCVSDDFNLKRILMEILTAVGENVMNAGLEQLQILFQAQLGGKKFFIVLDDVWNDDLVEWKKLEELLMTGAQGSRVLETTRDKKVAKIVRTMEPYVLKGLLEEECLSIFSKWAFKKGEEIKHPDLIEIGREVVKKCGGIPLAARTLGVLLYSKTSLNEWLLVRDSEMWAQVQNENDVIPILKLSYDQMSSSLKVCFGYCSIFLKDEKISKEGLIYQWMAHGFIQSSHPNVVFEDVCETYLEELLRRSFIEYVDPQEKYRMDDFVEYKMHDLVHDLAQYVVGEESLIVKGGKVSTASNRVRHVSIDRFSKIPKSLLQENNLRTMMWREPEKEFTSSVKKAILSCRSLRVPDFGNFTMVDDLPETFYKLKSLRFLCYRYAKAIPKSLCELLNLQYLDLSFSNFDKLPENIGNLRNLQVLIFQSPELICFPDGIRNLTSLRKLKIHRCRKLLSLGSLGCITSLEHLYIDFCDQLEFSNNDLQGLTSLKCLRLRGLPGLIQLPTGLQNSAPTLKQLRLLSCFNLTRTEEVRPNLRSLEVLEITLCSSVPCLPEGMQCLAKLNKLEINSFRLDKRCKPTGEDWPKIAHVPHVYVDGTEVGTFISGKIYGTLQIGTCTYYFSEKSFICFKEMMSFHLLRNTTFL